MLVNSQKPYSEETRQVAEEIGQKYDVAVMPVNCEQLKKEDIHRLLEKILYEFPLTAVEFYFPKWMDMLPVDHAVKQDLLRQIRELMNSYDRFGMWRDTLCSCREIIFKAARWSRCSCGTVLFRYR